MGMGFREEPRYKEGTVKTKSKGGLCSEASSDLELDTSSALPIPLWSPWAVPPHRAGIYRCPKHSEKGMMRLFLT